MLVLLEVLSRNRTLKSINLANNQLVENPSTYINEKNEEVLTKQAELVLKYLHKFLKLAPLLVHVDLTNVGFCEKMLETFGRTLRRSNSLKAIHLSGNPGLSDPSKAEKLIDYLVTRAHAVKVDSHNVINFRKLPSNLNFNEGYADAGQENVDENKLRK